MSGSLGGMIGSAGIGGINVSQIISFFAFFFGVLMVGLVFVIIFFFIMMRKSGKKIIEINMKNNRLRYFLGRTKKRKDGVKNFYISKIKKYLPDFQQDSTYLNRSQETVILLKDNNGMYHTAKVPTWDEIKAWYKVTHDLDIDAEMENKVTHDLDIDAEMENKDKLGKKEEELQKKLLSLGDIYLLPSPHEDLDWLAQECSEADKEFAVNHWWNSPTVMVLGTATVCLMMIVMTLIIPRVLG